MTKPRGILWLAIFVVTPFLLSPRARAQSGARPVHRGIQYMRGAALNPAANASAASANNPLNMTYLGGAVFPHPTVYVMWWGTPSDFPPDAQVGLVDFIHDLNGSTYLEIADQYFFGQKASIHFGGSFFDNSAPPIQDVPSADIVGEVYKVLTANGVTADPTALYVVYTSNFPIETYYCAYHDSVPAPDGTVIHVIYVPNETFFCETNAFDPLFSPDKHSEATRAMANSTAHEVMESMTDPNFDGWANPAIGVEIGDPCNFIFQSWVPLADSRSKIQEIWSNDAGGCVQGDGRPAQVLGDLSSAGAVTTFNIPAAIYGTFSQSINIFGAVAGYYTDANHEYHAFLQDSRGRISTIDPPNTGPGFYGGAQAFSINAEGAIAGNFGDTNFVLHGFVRDNKGNFVTIDVTGAAGTLPNGINNNGVVAGSYFDANSTNHGFVRDSLGNISTFDAPGAAPTSNGLFGGTTVLSINANGAVTGNYLDANSLSHGFVRHADGTIATFDAPLASQGTFPQSINDFGTIAGYYTDSNFVSHGFVRDALSHITSFDDPNATNGTFGLSVNAFGAVAGYYSDKNGFPQSFVRGPFGNFFTLPGKGANYGSVVRSINALGETAGYETAATN
jgi:hypothetical protein